MADASRAMNRTHRVRDWLRCVVTVALILGLTACASSESDTAIRVAQQYMRARTIQPGSSNNLYRNVTWDAGDRVVGELDEERFPDWARGMYVACVRWEETFTRAVADDETGVTTTQHGRADGWILIGDGMYHHILELTVDFDGHHFDWIRAWEPDS